MVQIKIRPKTIFTRHLTRIEAQNVMIRQCQTIREIKKKKKEHFFFKTITQIDSI